MWDDWPQYLRLIAALLFVLGLMGGLAYVLKRLGVSGPHIPEKKHKRLKVIEAASVDARRRLVLLQCDDRQHLVLLGPNSETVLKTDIEPPAQPDET